MSNKKTTRYSIALFLFFIAISPLNAQENVDNNRLKIEYEPALFFNNGRSVNTIYNITKNNTFGIGLYLLTTEIPNVFAEKMFNNYSPLSKAKATQEYALIFRYRFKVLKTRETNPYAGLLIGWENVRISTPLSSDVNISTGLITPHLGCEIYLYKKMVYVNPQIRSAFYVGQVNSDKSSSLSLKTYFILPSLSLGLRI